MSGLRFYILPLLGFILVLWVSLGSCNKSDTVPVIPVDTIPDPPLPHDTVNFYTYQGTKTEILHAGAIGRRDWLTMTYFYTLVLVNGNLGIDTHMDEFTGSGKCMEFWLNTAPNVSSLLGDYKHSDKFIDNYMMRGKIRTSGVYGSYSGETKQTDDGKLDITKPGNDYVITFTCNIGSDTIYGTYTGPVSIHIRTD